MPNAASDHEGQENLGDPGRRVKGRQGSSRDAMLAAIKCRHEVKDCKKRKKKIINKINQIKQNLMREWLER